MKNLTAVAGFEGLLTDAKRWAWSSPVYKGSKVSRFTRKPVRFGWFFKGLATVVSAGLALSKFQAGIPIDPNNLWSIMAFLVMQANLWTCGFGALSFVGSLFTLDGLTARKALVDPHDALAQMLVDEVKYSEAAVRNSEATILVTVRIRRLLKSLLEACQMSGATEQDLKDLQERYGEHLSFLAERNAELKLSFRLCRSVAKEIQARLTELQGGEKDPLGSTKLKQVQKQAIYQAVCSLRTKLTEMHYQNVDVLTSEAYSALVGSPVVADPWEAFLLVDDCILRFQEPLPPATQ